MTTDPFTLVLTAYLVMAAVMVGLRCHGSGHAWMAPDLDRPIGMGWALLKVTGIPWVERQALASRGEDYRAYQRTTNAFFPWFPRGSQ